MAEQENQSAKKLWSKLANRVKSTNDIVKGENDSNFSGNGKTGSNRKLSRERSDNDLKKLSHDFQEDIGHRKFDNWDPELCVRLIRLPNAQNYSGLKKWLTNCKKRQLTEFLELDGLVILFESLKRLCDRGFGSLSDAITQFGCVECVRAVVNSRIGLEFLVQHRESTRNLVKAFDTANVLVKKQLFELLSAVSIYSEKGYEAAVDALENYKVTRGQRYRLEFILNELKDATLTSYKSTILGFLNCIIISPPDLKIRLRTRNELVALGLSEILFKLREEDDPDLFFQCQVFDENAHSDHELAEASGLETSTDAHALFEIIFNAVQGTPHGFYLINVLQNLSQLNSNNPNSSQIWTALESASECKSQSPDSSSSSRLFGRTQYLKKDESTQTLSNVRSKLEWMESEINSDSLKNIPNVKSTRSSSITYGATENIKLLIEREFLSKNPVPAPAVELKDDTNDGPNSGIDENMKISSFPSSIKNRLPQSAKLPPPHLPVLFSGVAPQPFPAFFRNPLPILNVPPPPPPLPGIPGFITPLPHQPLPFPGIALPPPPPFPVHPGFVPPPPPFPVSPGSTAPSPPPPLPFPGVAAEFAPPPPPPPFPGITAEFAPPPPPPPFPGIAAEFVTPPPPPPFPGVTAEFVPPPPPFPMIPGSGPPPPFPTPGIIGPGPPPPLSQISGSAITAFQDFIAPPTMASYNMATSNKTRTPTRKPSQKMRVLNWTKIPDRIIGNSGESIWRTLRTANSHDNIKVNYEAVEELFSKKEETVENSPAAIKKKQITEVSDLRKIQNIVIVNIVFLFVQVTLLDGRKSLTVNIFLKQFKNSNDVVVSRIEEGNSGYFGIEKLQGFIKILPEKEEIETINGYTGDLTKLGTAEAFYLKLVKLSEFSMRLEAMLLNEEFAPIVCTLTVQLGIIEKSANDILHSKSLEDFLALVLETGNFLNSDSYAGNAAGFKLSSLPKLCDTRSNKPRVTLLHYLVDTAEKQDDQMLSFINDLPALKQATKITMDGLTDEVKQLRNRLHALDLKFPTSPQDFQHQFGILLEESKVSLKNLENRLAEVKEVALHLGHHFCEEQNFKLEEIFSIFQNFYDKLVQSKAENIQRVKLEEKAKRLKEEREKMQFNTPKKKSTKNRSTLDFISSDEDGCLVDKLLGQIRKGSFKLRKVKMEH